MTEATRLSPAKRLLFSVALIVGLPTAAFILLEGGSSLVLFANDLRRARVSARAQPPNATYDSLLGWTNLPNFSLQDLYGPGASLHTNSSGFRGSADTPDDPRPGTRRVICSGDSFTFGFGVDDDQAWCAQLQALWKGVETVNLGQGGYGVDQAYLRYKRDARRLAHQVHLFAFISQDFARMQRPAFLGHGKPVLTLVDDSLVVGNVPVPRRAILSPLLLTSASAFRELRVMELLSKLGGGPTEVGLEKADSPTLAVAEQIFDDLNRTNRAKRSVLVLVYLPTVMDFFGGGSNVWRRHLADFSARSGIPLVDLAEDLRRTPRDSIDALFFPQYWPLSPGAAGHYTAQGHAWVAERLRTHLAAMPAVVERLGQ